jgi:hypothetical protein
LSYVIDGESLEFVFPLLPLRFDYWDIERVDIFSQISWVFFSEQKLDGTFNIDTIHRTPIAAGTGDDAF